MLQFKISGSFKVKKKKLKKSKLNVKSNCETMLRRTDFYFNWKVRILNRIRITRKSYKCTLILIL